MIENRRVKRTTKDLVETHRSEDVESKKYFALCAKLLPLFHYLFW